MKLLSAKDVGSLRGTCKKMRALAESDALWCHVLQRDYEVKKEPLFDENTSSIAIYKQETEFEYKNKRKEFFLMTK